MIKSLFRYLISLLACFALSFVIAQDISPILQSGHTDDISYLKFSENNEYLITGGLDETVIFWEVNSQLQILSLHGFSGGVSCLDYHNDSNILVVGTYNNQVYVYDFDVDYYSPVEIYDFTQYITAVIISPNGKKIIVGSADYSVSIIEDWAIDRLNFESDITGLELSKDNMDLYVSTFAGTLYHIEMHVGYMKYTPILFYTANESISNICLSPSAKQLAVGISGSDGKSGEVIIVSTKNAKEKHRIAEFIPYLFTQSNSIKFLSEKQLLYKNTNSGISLYNFKSKESTLLSDADLDGGFDISKNTKYLAYGSTNEALMSKIFEANQSVIFKGYVDHPVQLMGQKGSKLIVEYKSGIKEWDLEKLQLEMLDEKFYENKWDHSSYSQDLSLFASSIYIEKEGRSWTSYRWDSKKRLIGEFSQNNRYYAYLTENGRFNFCDLSLVHPDSFGNDYFSYFKDYPENEARNYLNKIVFAPHKNEMVLLGRKIDIYNLDNLTINSINSDFRQADFALPAVYNPHDGYLLTAVRKEIIDTIPYSSSEGYSKEWRSVKYTNTSGKKDRYKNVMNGVVYLWDLEKRYYPLYFVRDPSIDASADISALLYDPHDSSIITGYTDGHISVTDATDSVYSYKLFLRVSGYGLRDLMLSDNGKFLFAQMDNGSIEVFERSTLKLLCRLIALDDNEFIIMDIDGYYKRSKNTTNSVAFWQAGSLSKLTQYDKIFNQPHRVMQKLGFVEDQKLALIKRLAQRQNTNYALDENAVQPKLSFYKEEQIQFTTSENNVCIQTLATSEVALDYMKIWVNGVPLYAEGKEPKAKSKKEWKMKWEVPLKYGMNLLKFQCFNEDGVSSNEKTVNIYCSKEYVKPNLYIACISVSDYQDSSMNLRYAVKDGRDFAKVFVDENGRRRVGFPSRFNEVYVDSFFNTNATRENILQWRNKILNTKPEDYVLLYVSGHGLLDDSLNFWFATHDIDFDQPNQRGMSYDELENLLVAIPAQQKLFLMDACHSGEVIKEELMVDSNFRAIDGGKGQLIGYSYRGTEVIDLDGEVVDRGELKQELFSNYISRSGATVISAAAGNSFALESPEWSNGIFTYTVIGGLIYRWADLNNDGEVSVVELSKYVSAEVKKQTDGLQVPNDRQENIENNFRIW